MPNHKGLLAVYFDAFSATPLLGFQFPREATLPVILIVSPKVVVTSSLKVIATAVDVQAADTVLDDLNIEVVGDVVVGVSALDVVPGTVEGHIPLPERRANGYKTFGRPPVRANARPPLESVTTVVQLMTSMSDWVALNPATDEGSATVEDEAEPILVKTATTW